MLVNLIGKIGYVNTSIALARDIKRVVEEFGETRVEVLHSS